MFYTPAVVIPGKVAHIKEEWAIQTAKKDRTVVYNDNFDIIHDFRDEQTNPEYRETARGN